MAPSLLKGHHLENAFRTTKRQDPKSSITHTSQTSIVTVPVNTGLVAATPCLDGLPAEIRDQIFQYLLSAEVTVACSDIYMDEEPSIPINGATREQFRYPVKQPKGVISPAILRTCRKFYDRCMPLLYANKTFQIEYHIAGHKSQQHGHHSKPKTHVGVSTYETLSMALQQMPHLQKVRKWTIDITYYDALEPPLPIAFVFRNASYSLQEMNYINWAGHIKNDVDALNALGQLEEVNMQTRCQQVYRQGDMAFILKHTLGHLEKLKASSSHARVHSPISSASHQFKQCLTHITTLTTHTTSSASTLQFSKLLIISIKFFNRLCKVGGYSISQQGHLATLRPIPGHPFNRPTGKLHPMRLYVSEIESLARLLVQADLFWTINRIRRSTQILVESMTSILRDLREAYVKVLEKTDPYSWTRSFKGWETTGTHALASLVIEQLNEIEALKETAPRMLELLD